MILRLVSIRQSNPFSIREMVMGETFAFLESSALLIIKDSLIFFTEFFVILDYSLLLWTIWSVPQPENLKEQKISKENRAPFWRRIMRSRVPFCQEKLSRSIYKLYIINIQLHHVVFYYLW